jgi:hypothetical protein
MALHRARQAAAERLHGELQVQAEDECLNEHVFSSLAQARRIIEALTHGAIGNKPPIMLQNCVGAASPPS